MTLNDTILVNLCNDIYSPQPDDYWEHFDSGAEDGICCGLKRLDGYDVIVLRGSVTAHDWVEDIRAIPVKTRIGTVHKGFYDGMEKLWAELKPLLKQPVAVTGHSLGAARADILAGLMTVGGVTPIRLSVFGEPKPGFGDFAKVIRDIPGESYRNGSEHRFYDIVTFVPITIKPLDAFVHRKPLVLLESPPPPALDQLSIFAFHHITLYAAAVAALKPEDIVNDQPD